MKASRAGVPGSILRLELGGRDYFVGLGALSLVFYSRLHQLCSVERSVGCFEHCLHRCRAGASDGGALLVYTVGPRGEPRGLAVCPACIALRDSILGGLWSFREASERAWRLHLEARASCSSSSQALERQPSTASTSPQTTPQHMLPLRQTSILASSSSTPTSLRNASSHLSARSFPSPSLGLSPPPGSRVPWGPQTGVAENVPLSSGGRSPGLLGL
ncbi:hypothetical protein Pdsh_02265 [Pyrodictium delaneyi]|uniref:Uncharacterized protein n=1 Tax=Pyrodictium delaneyi TaxID=1273541 RepID=A0A211YRF3_9CREN|nr:hypothetical protein Pdsh_02265 [Pyrodictium delaneyi]